MVAPLSGHSAGLVKAQVSHGVRQVSHQLQTLNDDDELTQLGHLLDCPLQGSEEQDWIEGEVCQQRCVCVSRGQGVSRSSWRTQVCFLYN